MSDDHNDPRDDSYPPGTVLVRATCASCGARFDAEGRETEGYPGEILVQQTETDCPACVELGCKPPVCPLRCWGSSGLHQQCGGSLKGNCAGFFECDACDSQFDVPMLRSLLFGRACEYIAKELFSLTPSLTRVRELTNLFLRKARELKVIQ